MSLVKAQRLLPRSVGEGVPPVDGSVPEMISPLSRLHSFFFQSPAMSCGMNNESIGFAQKANVSYILVSTVDVNFYVDYF